MTPILECKELQKTYGRKTILQNLTLQLESGHIIGLLGPNGSGKTTLLKLIAGLVTPSGGSILIQGTTPGTATKAMVSYLTDRPYLANWMCVKDALRYFQDFYEDFDLQRAMQMLTSLQIDINDPMKTMSRGTCEKVQLVLVMSRRAKLYLLDEPMASVDPAARDFILKTILTNYDSDASILLCTHLIADVESILDDVILLDRGKMKLHATVDEIREKNGCSVDALFREEFRC